MLIAVTSSDETNMIACQVAYTLFRTPMKIARIRESAYLTRGGLFHNDAVPIDVLISPEQAVTTYIKRLIENPGALQVLDFAEGKVQLVAVRAYYGGPLVGQELRFLRQHMPGIETRVAAIFRRDRPIIPKGDTVIEADDEVFFVAATPDIVSETATVGDMGIIGGSQSMQTLFKRIGKVAPTDSTVLIQGESGTGKELVARALHEHSRRINAPMISVNCAAIPETLIESELFGHEKGSFTGATAGRTGLVEAADGGTLFLDEIGELPLEAQARLLRVLQEGEIRRVGSVQSHKVDVRLVAATHRDLKTLARQGLFREDLYYRLNVIELRLPPLREREDDVMLIAEALLRRAAKKMGLSGLHFTQEAANSIRQYNWPGNVRELENAIERAAILCDEDEISTDLLGIELDAEYQRASEAASALETMRHSTPKAQQDPTEDLSLEDYFQHFVLEHQEHMTETELANKLGISRKCLWERRQRLGIPRNKSTAVIMAPVL